MTVLVTKVVARSGQIGLLCARANKQGNQNQPSWHRPQRPAT